MITESLIVVIAGQAQEVRIIGENEKSGKPNVQVVDFVAKRSEKRMRDRFYSSSIKHVSKIKTAGACRFPG